MPLISFAAAILAILAGLLFGSGERRGIRWLTLIAAVGVGVIATSAAYFVGAVNDFGFAFAARWPLYVILTGLYEASGFILATLLIPWAAFPTRLKAGMGMVSAALIAGYLTYRGGDRMLALEYLDFIAYSVLGVLFAVAIILAVLVLKRSWKVGAKDAESKT